MTADEARKLTARARTVTVPAEIEIAIRNAAKGGKDFVVVPALNSGVVDELHRRGFETDWYDGEWDSATTRISWGNQR